MNIKYAFPLLLISFLFVACSQPSVPSPTETAAEAITPTSAPTVAPTMAPTAVIEPTPTADSLPNGGASTLLQNGEGQGSAWRGIGRLFGSSSCTASFIATSTNETATAYALTNGHCIEWQANGVVVLPEFGGELIFNYFVDTQAAQINVPISSIPYSTMQGADLAIIELDATIGELTAQGVQPLALADAPLADDREVYVIGIPTSGLPTEEAFLRLESCRLTGRANLIEFQWHFNDTYRTSCQDIFGGSSGSPLFSAEDDVITAVINTTVEGMSPCYLGVPCEITPDGAMPNPGSSYAIPVHGLASCFDEAGEFSLTNECPLPPVEQLAFDSLSPLGQPPLTWATTLTGTLPFYRYKTGAAGVVDCRSAEGYSPTITLADRPLIDDAIPDEEGFYLLCVQAGESAAVGDSWQSLDYPTVTIAQIDITPPQLEPQIAVQETPDFIDVSLIFQPPELSDYLFKIGPAEMTDCAVEEDYFRYRRIPLTIERDDGPIRLCVIGFDNANNATPPLDTVFDE